MAKMSAETAFWSLCHTNARMALCTAVRNKLTVCDKNPQEEALFLLEIAKRECLPGSDLPLWPLSCLTWRELP